MRPAQWWSGHHYTCTLCSPHSPEADKWKQLHSWQHPRLASGSLFDLKQAISNSTREERGHSKEKSTRAAAMVSEESREMRWGAKELKPDTYEFQTHYYFQNSRHLLAGARSRKKTKRFLTTGWENYGDATWCDCGVLERFNALIIPLNTWAWCWRGCPWASAWSAKPGHKSRFR